MTLPSGLDLDRWHRTGDREALAQLMAAALDRAYAQARRTLGNDADAQDATQEALLQIMRSADRYDPARPFAPWLARHVHDACCRLRWREGRLKRRERIAPPPAPEPAEAEVDPEAVRSAVAELPERDRAAIELHYWAGLSQAETAAALGTSENALAVRLHRARERLRTMFAGRGIVTGAAALTAALVPNDAWAAPSALAEMLRSLPSGPLPTTTLPLGPTGELGFAAARHPWWIAAAVAIALATAAAFICASGRPAPPAGKAAAPPPPPPPPPAGLSLDLAVDPAAAPPWGPAELAWTVTNHSRETVRFRPWSDARLATRVTQPAGVPDNHGPAQPASLSPEMIEIPPGDTALLHLIQLDRWQALAHPGAWTFSGSWSDPAPAPGTWAQALESVPATLRLDPAAVRRVAGELRVVDCPVETGADGQLVVGRIHWTEENLVGELLRGEAVVGMARVINLPKYREGLVACTGAAPAAGDRLRLRLDDDHWMLATPPPADAGATVNGLRLELRFDRTDLTVADPWKGHLVVRNLGDRERPLSFYWGDLRVSLAAAGGPAPKLVRCIGRGMVDEREPLAEMARPLKPGEEREVASFLDQVADTPDAPQFGGSIGTSVIVGWRMQPGTYRVALRYRMSFDRAVETKVPGAWLGSVWSNVVEMRVR